MNTGVVARVFLALLAFATGCAHVEPPPGGPEDLVAPQLLVTRPDSLSVVPGITDPVVLVFDERVSERGLNDIVMVSPRTSTVRVDHRRDELRVSLREGWQPGTIYHVTVLPNLEDLFGNRRDRPLDFVFSTGPEIPETYAEGAVVDALTGEPEIDIRVEAIRQADSLVYATRTDTAGIYRFRRIPTGEYTLRAFQDMNRNRALDAFEPRDSTFTPILVGDTASNALAILMPDSTPPLITSVTVRDDLMEVEFDDHLDPAQQLNTGRVNISDEAGSFIPVMAVGFGSAPPAAVEPGADTLAAAETPDRPADDAEPEELLPSRSLFFRLAEQPPLLPEVEYTVTVIGVRNVNGLAADAERTFTVEEPPAAIPAGEDPATEPVPDDENTEDEPDEADPASN